MASTLTIGTGTSIVLSGGRQRKRLLAGRQFQRLLATTSIFKGNILAAVTITVNNGGRVEGRCLPGRAAARAR